MRRRALAALTAFALMGTGCGALKLEQLPAPHAVSGPTYHLTVQFSDVSNLVLGAKVKLQGVVIGDVTSISTHDFRADVGMEVARTFPLSSAATFQVRFSTPLGEDFIAVTSPATGGTPLANGATVLQRQSSAAPGIEDTFAALSLLLNGGGLDKLHIIADELDTALKGRAGTVRDTLVQLHAVIANFDANKGDVDRALQSLAAMSTQLDKGSALVQQALASFPQALQLLASDTGQVRVLLGKVAALGDTVQSLLSRSQADLFADFDALRPTLDALRASESTLVPSMDSLIRFGQLFDRAAPGDYLNLDVTIQFLLNAAPQRPVAGGIVHPDSEPTVVAHAGSARGLAQLAIGGGS